MEVTLSGMVIDVNDERSNALAPMLVTLDGIFEAQSKSPDALGYAIKLVCSKFITPLLLDVRLIAFCVGVILNTALVPLNLDEENIDVVKLSLKKVTDVNDEQSKNALTPMLVTLSGMVIDVNDERSNALAPMLVTPSGMVIDVNDEH